MKSYKQWSLEDAPTIPIIRDLRILQLRNNTDLLMGIYKATGQRITVTRVNGRTVYSWLNNAG